MPPRPPARRAWSMPCLSPPPRLCRRIGSQQESRGSGSWRSRIPSASRCCRATASASRSPRRRWRCWSRWRSGTASASAETLPAGALHYQATGDALPGNGFTAAEAADAILLGAMGWPDVRYPDGTEIAPQLDLRDRARALCRRAADAGASPACRRRWPIRARGAIDCVLIREVDRRPVRVARQGPSIDGTTTPATRCAITRGDHRAAVASSRSGWPQRRAQGARRHAAASPASTRRTCFRRWRSSAASSTRCAARHPDIDADASLRRRDGARPGAQAVGIRRAGRPRTCSATSCRISAAALMGGMGMAPSRRHRRRARACSSRATARRPTSPARASPTRRRCSCRRR